MATATTMEELEPLVAEQVALYLLACRLAGRTPEPPEGDEQLDLRDYLEEGEEPEIIYVAPASMSIVSIAIETARREEGISYADLARRMGVSRSAGSTVSREDSMGVTGRATTCTRSVRGGRASRRHRPDIGRRPRTTRSGLATPYTAVTMPRPITTRPEACRRIAAHRSELVKMGVSSVMLFGSIARDELTDASDVDVLVEFERPVGAFEFLDVQEYLECILGRSVDLATPAAIKPRMRQHVFDEAVRAA